MSSIPSESLQKLFNDLDFLSASLTNQKPCFKNRFYVDSDSWIGYFWRRIDGENQANSGNSEINSICRNASENYESYKNNKFFGIILLNKIVEARKGLDRIRNTYKKLNQISTVSSINNNILILDNVIPIDRKITEGFLLDTNPDNINYERSLPREILNDKKLINENNDKKISSSVDSTITFTGDIINDLEEEEL